MIEAWRRAMWARNVGHGFLVWIFTVYGSTISTRSMGANDEEPRSLLAGFARRSMLNFTASALKSSPLWNLTPRRSLNSHVVGATSFGISAASTGTSLRLWSRSSSASNICAPTLDAGVSCWFIMSSDVGSTPCAMTTCPAGAAKAAAGNATARTSAAMLRQRHMRTPPREREMSSVWTAPTLGFARERVKIRERVFSRPQAPEVLGLAQPREHPPDRRAGREPEPRHHVLAPEERGRRADGVHFHKSGEKLAEQARAAPDAEGRGARHGGGVDEREEQEVLSVLGEVTIDAVARPVGHRSRGRQVHRAQVVAHEPLEDLHGARPQPQPLADRARARGADHVVLEEADAP